MAAKRPRPPPRTTRKRNQHTVRLKCPECESHQALVVATHYGEMMCFCPTCEHVWDCPDALTT